MINVIFPPGGYGHYFAALLYLFTDLAVKDPTIITIDGKTGSSHLIKENIKNIILLAHENVSIYSGIPIDYANKTICLLPSKNNMLDYLDNSLIKTDDINGDYKKFLINLLGIKVHQKLKHWGDSADLNSVWIVREYISFVIFDVVACETYNFYYNYNSDAAVKLPTTALFEENFFKVFVAIAKDLGLQVVNDGGALKDYHQDFLNKQKFHGIQQKCDIWTNNVINNNPALSPCQTIFDEAYVQAKLRILGFEIQCYNLNEFPKNSVELHKLLIPI